MARTSISCFLLVAVLGLASAGVPLHKQEAYWHLSAIGKANKTDRYYDVERWIKQYVTALNTITEDNMSMYLDLWADNLSMWDPVGNPVKTSKASIAASMKCCLPLEVTLDKWTVAQDETQGAAVLTFSYPAMKIYNNTVIETFQFDNSGLLVDQKAFWHLSAIGMAKRSPKYYQVEASIKHYVAALNAITKNNMSAYLDLWADNMSMWDPVGKPAITSKASIAAGVKSFLPLEVTLDQWTVAQDESHGAAVLTFSYPAMKIYNNTVIEIYQFSTNQVGQSVKNMAKYNAYDNGDSARILL